MGRRKTTGKFATREELIENIHTLRQNGKTIAEVASICGVSGPVVSTLTRQAPRQDNSVVGLWCSCYQKVEGFKLKIPFQGKIIKDLRGYWVLQVGKQQVKVNRGACSKEPFKR